jgi:hypothetical protein
MNRFGEIADELTDLIEELEAPGLASESKALRAALARAFSKACEAERVLRLKQQAEPIATARPLRRRAAGGAGFGVVIELPVDWNRPASPDRRLND